MRYQRFVRMREPVWDRFAAALARSANRAAGLDHAQLEEAALLYRQVLHDLALARDRFPATAAVRRLRRLAQAGTRLLTHERRRRAGGPLRFFWRTYPLTFRRQAPLVALTAALFLVLALFGFVASFSSPALGTALIGEQALAGLEEGRLWTEVLTTRLAPAASSAIATNNVSVGLTAFAGGAVAGLGALWVVIVNGLMLGSVVGVTLHYGMAGSLLEFVAAHGPAEITVILTSAAAGLVLGRAVVAADDRPRSVALKAAARDGVVLMAGCLPWLVLLALIEAFISPSPDYSLGFKALLGLALETLFLLAAVNPFLRLESR